MASPDLSILLRALDGQWEQCGRDRLAGITPQAVRLTANRWGSDRASFTLRRRAWAPPFPDLTAFTDCDAWVRGQPVWSGRVIETPTQDGRDHTVSVEGQGWQYHLDDDVWEPFFAHTRTADWRDCRTRPDATLGTANLFLDGSVKTDDGIVTLGFPNNTAVVAGAHCGVFLDVGPDATAKRVVLEWESSNNTAALTLYCRGSNVTGDPVQAGNSDFENAFTIVMNSAASGTTAGTFTNAKRFVSFFLFNAAFNGTTGADHYFKLKAIRVFADTAYESGNNSALKSSQVITKSLDRTTVLLSTDRSQIDPDAAAVFVIPEYAPGELKSPREDINAANAPHDWVTMVDVNRRMIFKARPTAPLFEVGHWSGCEFKDASANSGEDLYNRAITRGQGPDSTELMLRRHTAESAAAAGTEELLATPSNSNPSFDTNVTGWTHNVGTFARDTVDFDTSPASGRADVAAAGVYFVQSPAFTGTFLRGHTYKLTVWLSIGTDTTGVSLKFGENTDVATKTIQWVVLPNTTTHTIFWTPNDDRTAAVLRVDFSTDAAASGAVYIDTLKLFENRNATLIDRRGFRRTKILPVGAAISTAFGERLADTYLGGHRTTPLKGDVDVIGPSGVRRVLGGAPVHPAMLLRETNQLVRLSHRIDPDTGGLGRDGTLAAVSYDDDAQSASVAIDNERDKLALVLAQHGAA